MFEGQGLHLVLVILLVAADWLLSQRCTVYVTPDGPRTHQAADPTLD